MRRRSASSWATYPENSWPRVSGTASIRWVRPILVMLRVGLGLGRPGRCGGGGWPGRSRWVISSTAAMCMAVGKVSLDDWDMLTSSLGWTGSFEPITPPAISMARLEITSLAFMLLCVPLPVCHTLRGNWSFELALGHLAGRGHDQCRLLRGHLAQVGVDLGRRLLQHPDGPDQRERHPVVPDGEMVERAGRLGTPVPVGGDLDRPHAVGLDRGSRWSWPHPLARS